MAYDFFFFIAISATYEEPFITFLELNNLLNNFVDISKKKLTGKGSTIIIQQILHPYNYVKKGIK